MGNVKTQKKKDRSLVALTTSLIVIGVLIVLILAYTIVNSFGVFGRMNYVAESKNTKVTENMMEYVKFQQINALSQYFGSYTSNYLQQLNTIPDGASISTFDVQVLNSIKTTLLYYEAAMADADYLKTVDLADFDRQAEAAADTLEKNLKKNGYSISDYFYSWGLDKGVSKKDISAMQKLSLICNDYQEYLSDVRFAAGEKDYKNDMAGYLEKVEADKDNKSKYYFADYETYVYKTSEEKITKNEKLKDGNKELTLDDLKEAIKAGFEKETDQEAALKAITEKKDLTAAYSDSTSGYQKWMFESDRKADDTYLSVSTSSGTTTYTLYVLKKTCYLDADVEMRDLYHIAFPYASGSDSVSKEDAKKAAEEFLAAFKQNGADGTAFDKLAKDDKYSTYSFSRIYREKKKTESLGKEVTKFVFGEEIKVGDVQVVEAPSTSSEGSGVYYVVLVSKVYDIPNWAANYIINGISDDLTAWEKADKSCTDLGVKLTDAYQKKVDKYNKATETTASDTTKAEETTKAAETTKVAETTKAEETTKEDETAEQTTVAEETTVAD